MPNLLANLHQKIEADATDMIFCDNPAHCNGAKVAHVFVSKESKLFNIYPVEYGTQEDFVGVMQHQVYTQGSPTKLIADNALMYYGSKVTC